MNDSDTVNNYYRRRLPHYQPSDAIYFVTFRLADSLPHEIVLSLKEEYSIEENRITTSTLSDTDKKEELQTLRKQYFGKYESLLHSGSTGPLWLKEPEIASIVTDAIHHRDEKVYELLCYCIMPNHVHLVIDVSRFAESQLRLSESPYILTNILASLKKYTALNCNRVLNRSGTFWQHESYDHVVRNGKELERILHYVINNPVKAGFVKEWREWKWTYLKEGLL